MIIDAHAHLWKKQQGKVNGKDVFPVGDGKSNFGGVIRQMMPPYMNDDENTAERFIANMNYAGVSGAVITQEEIDGNQDAYLLEAKAKYPDRLKICSLYEDGKAYTFDGFDGIKICGGRLTKVKLEELSPLFHKAEDFYDSYDNLFIMELFHGPTLAFKDVALTLLPYFLSVL